MSHASRLSRLERSCPPRPPDGTTTLPSDPEALLGGLLWPEVVRAEQQGYRRHPHSSGPLADWWAAAFAAWDRGIRDYDDAGLEQVTLAVWLDMRPRVLERQRQAGVWVHDESMPEAPDYPSLPLPDKLRLLTQALQRRGHWSKA